MDESSSTSNGHQAPGGLGDSASGTSSSTSQKSMSIHNLQNDGLVYIYCYSKREFQTFLTTQSCEEICTIMCKSLQILPTAQLLYGLREHQPPYNWILPCETLQATVRYCFRMRFRVPDLDNQLRRIDIWSHRYLYSQMRFDLLHEHISEIRYPEHKDKSSGLAVLDMCIDREELDSKPTDRSIEKNYSSYLPHSLYSAHRFLLGPKIRSTYRKLRAVQPAQTVDNLKYHYVQQVSHLAPTYMDEQFTVVVEQMPNEEGELMVAGMGATGNGSSSSGSIASSTRTTSTLMGASSTTLSTMVNGHGQNGHKPTTSKSGKSSKQKGNQRAKDIGGITVYVKLWPHDSPEPGLKVARESTKPKWFLVADVEDIISISASKETLLCLEIRGFPNTYKMHFDTEGDMKSFISYLGIYIRLTDKWMHDLCSSYRTPSLKELTSLNCHGPIGGSYSLQKLHDKSNTPGSYMLRQCEREYNTYYIDINTQVLGRRNNHDRCKTETFKILRNGQHWTLFITEKKQITFTNLTDLAQSIPCLSDGLDRHPIPPSSFDKSTQLLLCLPKNLRIKKTDTELSEAELQRRNPQIFNPSTDLQWYQASCYRSDDGVMFNMLGEWVQKGSIKNVPVNMKMLRIDVNNTDHFKEFSKLGQWWGLMQSPQFIKLYGLTLCRPYTMVLEYSQFGPLDRFLQEYPETDMYCLLEVMRGLVRGMHYLEDYDIMHPFIRCSNLYVTKYSHECRQMVAKIGDPGIPRPYNETE